VTVFTLVPFFDRVYINFLNYNLNVLVVIACFLFIGAVGKSAQLGLHTWLPDAMKSPPHLYQLLYMRQRW
jgi:NADH:ubiquinone oxidoreductase subunit 5 (subunit L)/multisubunit Na+/H+ antiporter MnhA subunit